MIERIKVAWYALTKKEYAFFSIQRHEIGNNGGKCIISSNATPYFFRDNHRFYKELYG